MHTSEAPLTDTQAAQSATAKPPIRKTLLGIGAGNAVEWYDWTIYATFASFISTQLFSTEDPTSAFLSTLAIFAVGFVARPFGGFLFGYMGDKLGRKAAMTSAVALASIGSLLIAVIPTYDAIGWLASALLVVGRILQGLAHGGELPSAQTYLSEIAPAPKRGLFASLIYFSGTAGIVLGTLLGAILAGMLDGTQMAEWGWRIPFAVGALFGLYSLVMRARLKESKQFTDTKALEIAGKREPMMPQIWRSRKQALQVIGLTVGLTVVYYIWSVSTPAYAITALKMDATTALWTGVAANLCFMAFFPFWGKLSDRIGRRPVLIIGALGSVVLQLPMSSILHGEWWQLFIAMVSMLFFIAASAAIVPAVYAELFPTSIRTIGVAIPYAFVVAAFGGTAAFLQAGFNEWFEGSGSFVFSCYAILLLLISAFTAYKIPETRGKVLV